MMHAPYLAFLAVIPMVSGPAPQEPHAFTAKLCGGGEISIPLHEDKPAQGRDCHQQACHAGTCREKAKKPV